MSAALVEILAGLRLPEKMISPKYFYDERGSQLFDEITHLPEYYPTETELGIMLDNMPEICGLIGNKASLIEFGSGSSRKTRALLDGLQQQAVYVPVDISEEHLLLSAEKIRSEHPGLEVLPVVADFTQTFDLPDPTIMPLRNIVYFPGSTIGNFTHDAAHDLLKVMHQEVRADGALLIGVDLRKDPAIIERAYNDSAGVTAQFNLNMLTHLNREFGFDFDVSAFTHSAHYDADAGRMVLRSSWVYHWCATDELGLSSMALWNAASDPVQSHSIILALPRAACASGRAGSSATAFRAATPPRSNSEMGGMTRAWARAA